MLSTDLIEHANKLYENSNYKNILKKVSNIYVPIDLQSKNIGICLSGGADSALLTYILCDIITKNSAIMDIHIITSIRMWKVRPWQEEISKNVFDYFVKKFPNINFHRHCNFVPPEFEWGSTGPSIVDEYGKINSGDVIELRAFSEYIIFKYNLNAWYTTANKNPSGIHIDDRLSERDIEKIEIDQLINIRHGFYMIKPFLYLEKDWIINCYKKLDIMELFNLTRSCEGDTITYPEIFKGLSYKTYTAGQCVPTCEQCFWCKERKWGLENS